MTMGRTIGYGLVVVFVVFILTGCERLKRWDAKVGEIFFSEEPATTTAPFWEDLGTMVKKRIASSSKINIDEIDIKEFVKDLNKEQKEKIEAWIKDEGLNRYADPADTYYTGGTPLFNEATGETIERFEYILENNKEVIKLLGM